MAKIKPEFINPYDAGVSYVDFLAAIPKEMTVEEYIKGNLEADQIEWLLKDLKVYQDSLNQSEDITPVTDGNI